jgi:malonate-semialdehyde dehydrogenase (acetylating)/methylmalonate-semialdehyde dehydrogenase
MRNTVQHWSFGGTSAAIAPVTNPATGAVTGEVALGSLRRL